MIAVAVALVPRFAFGAALHPSFYHRTPGGRSRRGRRRGAGGITVEAADHVGPHLSGRDTVLLFDGDGESPRFSPWVVADVTHREFTFPSRRAERQRVALLEKHGYQVTFRRDGLVVLHAPRAAR